MHRSSGVWPARGSTPAKPMLKNKKKTSTNLQNSKGRVIFQNIDLPETADPCSQNLFKNIET